VKPARRTVLKACATAIGVTAATAAVSKAALTCFNRRVKWIAFYGQNIDEKVLASYDIVVLDPMFEGSVTAIAKDGARVYGYLSLGEIRTSDRFYDAVDPAALLEENPAWPGTRRIDVRQHSWKDLIVREILPFIARKGFTGLMLDTLDTPPYLELVDPAGKAGMRKAAIDLVHSIHRSRPGMSLIMNRGYALLPEVLRNLDWIVAESLLTSPDKTDAHGYKWNDQPLVEQQLALLAPAIHRHDRVSILSLDYWDPDDTRTIAGIYHRQRQLGHIPYVATPMLDRIIPEPT
jgi:uncharacterized protein (TIGR01370 family)